MDPFQYKDLPQIPALTDEQHFNFWATEHFSQFHTNQDLASRTFGFRREDIDYEELGGHGSLDMQPMQRFLHGMDPTPFSAGLLHANLDRTMSLPSQHSRLYERQWPPVEYLPNASRNGSPDRTSVSGTSSYAPQNELRSPHPSHNASYDSPMDYAQARVSYPSPELMNDTPYPSELPIPGNSINLRALELHHEPEAPMDDHEHIESKSDYDYDQEPTYTKAEASTDSYPGYAQPQLVPAMAEPEHYADSGGGNRMRDAESVQPMTQSDESDSDYKPTSRTTKKRRSSTSSRSSGRQGQKRHGRKDSSVSSQSNPHRVTKRPRGSNASLNTVKSPGGTNAGDSDAQRPFPCPLAGYGCQSNFVSKNEWKRHVSTQHIKLGFWRCDLCPTTVDPHDDQTVYHNDFNRKDLFTQHLRRMHSAPTHARNKAEYPVNEDNLIEHQKRCYQVLRETPPQSACLFCDKRFIGPTSWEERMEHVGRHLEKDRKTVSLDVTTWNEDKELEQWLLEEGLIAHDRNGGWKIGDGKPRRDSILDGGEDSDVDD